MRKFHLLAAASALAALAACSDNDGGSSSKPVEPPPPPPPPPPAAAIVQDGARTTYNNGATARAVDLARANAFAIRSQGNVTPESDALSAYEASIARVNRALTNIRGVNSADMSQADVNYVNTQIALINDELAFDSLGITIPNAQVRQSSASVVAAIERELNGPVADERADREDVLEDAYVARAGTTSRSGEIKLADGTVVQTHTTGIVSANRNGAYVQANVVAAYEEDAAGRVTRVAFVETSGTPYGGVAPGARTYTAQGQSFMAIRVDDGFFDTFVGESRVQLDIGRQSGNVLATGSKASGDNKDIIKSYVFGGDVMFDPAKGTFSTQNGKLTYQVGPRTAGQTGMQTYVAENGLLLGQIHDQIGSRLGAAYTGVLNVDGERVDATGAIIGTERVSPVR